MSLEDLAFVEVALPDGLVGADDDLLPGESVLGGAPVWLVPGSVDLACRCCGCQMYMLAQFENSFRAKTQRVLYVFCCNTRRCSQDAAGWRVMAQERDDAGAEAKRPAALWDSLMSTEEVAERVQAMGIHGKSLPAFPAQYLHITDEIILSKSATKRERDLERKALEQHGLQGEFDPEAFEASVRPPGYDKSMSAFQKRVLHYPKQCIRISEQPLWFSKVDHEVSFECGKCRGRKAFEFQLMPAILALLPVEQTAYVRHIKELSTHPLVANGMEWATVLCYSCGRCPGEELSVFIQVEPEFASFQ